MHDSGYIGQHHIESLCENILVTNEGYLYAIFMEVGV